MKIEVKNLTKYFGNFVALNDIKFSKNLDYLIENLFELQNSNKNAKQLMPMQEMIDPSDLEYFVIQAIKKRDITLFTQEAFEDEKTILLIPAISIRSSSMRVPLTLTWR